MRGPLLVSATLAFVIPLTATYSLPLHRNTTLTLAPLEITSPLHAPENLTYKPWPKTPFSVGLRGPGLRFLNLVLCISGAKLFQSSPTISGSELKRFLQDFVDNIQREHPVPGFVPRLATQSTVDVTSCTRWTIDINEGPFHGRLPTAVALVALDAIEMEERFLGHPSSSLITSTSAVDARDQFIIDTEELGRNVASKLSKSPQEYAAKLCRRHLESGSVVGEHGCWVSSHAGSEPYVNINLHNTHINGARLGFSVSLRQLSVIGAGRMGELLTTLKVGDTLPPNEVLHLCHNGRCFRPSHPAIEPKNKNKDRQVCNGHYVITRQRMKYNPCRHGAGSVKRDCLLPALALAEGVHYHPLRAKWAQRRLNQHDPAGT